MRIISQDGMVDVPYDMSIVNIDYMDKKRIIAAIVGCGGEENIYQMAKYSTEEKAFNAMKMLRDAYMCYAIVRSDDGVFQFPKDEDVEVGDET